MAASRLQLVIFDNGEGFVFVTVRLSRCVCMCGRVHATAFAPVQHYSKPVNGSGPNYRGRTVERLEND